MKNNILLLLLNIFLTTTGFAQYTNESPLIVNLKEVLLEKQIDDKVGLLLSEGYLVFNSDSPYGKKGDKVSISGIDQDAGKLGKEDQKKVIHAYFDQLKKVQDYHREMEGKFEVYDSIKKHLKIRMMSSQAKAYAENTVVRESFPGILECLVIDGEASVRFVDKGFLEIWGMSESKLFKVARENTLQMEVKLRTMEELYKISKTVSIHALMSQYDIFVTSCMVDLEKFDLPEAKYGSLVVVPNRQALFYSPVDKTEIGVQSLTMVNMSQEIIRSEPNLFISDNLFWYYKGKYYLVEIDYQNQSFEYPKKLKRLLDL